MPMLLKNLPDKQGNGEKGDRLGFTMTNAANGHKPRCRHSSFQDTAIADACRLRVEYVLVKAAHGFLDAA